MTLTDKLNSLANISKLNAEYIQYSTTEVIRPCSFPNAELRHTSWGYIIQRKYNAAYCHVLYILKHITVFRCNLFCHTCSDAI